MMNFQHIYQIISVLVNTLSGLLCQTCPFKTMFLGAISMNLLWVKQKSSNNFFCKFIGFHFFACVQAEKAKISNIASEHFNLQKF